VKRFLASRHAPQRSPAVFDGSRVAADALKMCELVVPAKAGIQLHASIDRIATRVPTASRRSSNHQTATLA